PSVQETVTYLLQAQPLVRGAQEVTLLDQPPALVDQLVDLFACVCQRGPLRSQRRFERGDASLDGERSDFERATQRLDCAISQSSVFRGHRQPVEACTDRVVQRIGGRGSHCNDRRLSVALRRRLNSMSFKSQFT